MTIETKYPAYKESGFEWLGEIPSNWKILLISQVVTQVRNKNIDLEEQNLLSLSYGKIKRKAIDSNEGLLPASFDNYNIIEHNDIVLRLTDLQNDHTSLRVGLSKERGIITSAYITLRPRESEDARYIYYVLHTFDILKGFYGMGAGVRQGLNFDEIRKLQIPYPTKEEQQQIADYLDDKLVHIDELIKEAKACVEEYKVLRIAVVNDAVTHGIRSANLQLIDSGVDWIGKIPDNWKIVITKRLFCIKKEIAGEEGHTVLSITQKGIIPKQFGGKGQFAADYSNYQRVNKGDFAMNHMDLLTGWVDISDYEGVTSPDYRVFVQTGFEQIYASYYKYVFQNCYSCKIYYGLGHGVAGLGRWRLPADMFLNFKLPYPPINEQKEIASYLDDKTKHIDSLISEKQSLIEDLQAYKNSLIYEVVTGKRKVV